jgi:hypothetical protein
MPGPYTAADTLNYVAFGKESVKGTGVAPTLFVPYIEPVSLDHGVSMNSIREPSGMGQVTYTEKQGHMPGGQFTMLCRPSTTAKLLAYLLGTYVSAVTGAGPYTHLLKESLTTVYLSAEQNLANDAIERFVDAQISQLVFKVDEQNRALRCEGQWVGLTPGWQASPTAESYEAATPFLLSDCTFTVDGSGATNVQGFTLTISFTTARPPTSKVTGDYIVKLSMDVTLELKQIMSTASAEYRKVVYGASGNTAVQPTVTSGAFIADFQYGTSGALRELKFELATLDWEGDAKYTDLNPEGDLVLVTRTGHATIPIGAAGPMIKITAQTNDSAAYVP